VGAASDANAHDAHEFEVGLYVAPSETVVSVGKFVSPSCIDLGEIRPAHHEQGPSHRELVLRHPTP